MKEYFFVGSGKRMMKPIAAHLLEHWLKAKKATLCRAKENTRELKRNKQFLSSACSWLVLVSWKDAQRWWWWLHTFVAFQCHQMRNCCYYESSLFFSGFGFYALQFLLYSFLNFLFSILFMGSKMQKPAVVSQRT